MSNQHLLAQRVCEEAPVSLMVNGQELATFMCTPESLHELAVGYLFSRGLVSSVDQIYTLGACDEMRQVWTTVGGEIGEEQYSLAGVLASGCGSGMVFSQEFLALPQIETDLTLSLAYLQDTIKQMYTQAVLHQSTGGVHCAALADQRELLCVREDVGRHNAVDKVIGKGLFLQTDFTHAVVFTTGRLSSDMLLKAVRARVPIVVSRSIPTTLALQIGQQQGITIVGRILSSQPTVFCHEQRIVDHAL